MASLLPVDARDARRDVPERRDSAPAVVFLFIASVVVPIAIAAGLYFVGDAPVAAVAFGLMALTLLFARPFWGLLFFVALLYARPEDAMPALGNMRIALAVSLVTLCGFWCQMFLNRDRAVRSPLNGMIFGFGCMVVISTAAGGDPLGAAQDIGKIVILVLLILNLLRTPQRYRAFTAALMVFITYMAAYSIYLYYAGGGQGRSQGTGVFADPNDLAASVVAGVVLALTRMGTTRARNRVFCLGSIAVIIWAILLTHSRGGLLSLSFGVCAALTMLGKRKVVRAPFALLAVLVLFSLGSGRATNFDSRETSANNRFWFWNNGIIQLMSHPLTGVGYQQFPLYNEGRAAHSAFVMCFAEVGLPGYFFWMGGLYYAFRRRTLEEPPLDATDEAQRELLGARLALATYLFAVFWLSHTYMPVLYILMTLPFAQQVAYSGRTTILPLTPQERWHDWVRIGQLCIGSIVLIRLMIARFG